MSEQHKYKKFIVFAYEDYYPSGGLGDIKADFETMEEALQFTEKLKSENIEIVNRDTWEMLGIEFVD